MIDSMRVAPIKSTDGFDLPMKASVMRAGEGADAMPFSEVLRDSVKKVNDLQVNADNMSNRLALGEVEDISEVSIAVEKAELALRLMVQIRDKLLDAYQQIARMTV
jgi:flagellar hook-basal body complex protein FliE